MAQVSLRSNSQRISWPPVLWADGSRLPVILQPGEGWFDSNGYLRFFSLQFPNGDVENYKLLPRDLTTDTVLSISKDFLLPFGLTVLSNSIISGNSVIENVAQEVFEQFGQIVIGDYFERMRISNSAYYNIAKGWPVIEQPLQL